MGQTLFGIFHTAYERAPSYFFEAAKSNYINTFLVESDYRSEEFAVSMNEITLHSDKKAWLGVTYLGFKSINNVTIADNGESKSEFNPTTEFFADFRQNVDAMLAELKARGWYDSVEGFYMDEPMLWNIKNDWLEEFTGYFRTEAAPEKRFFVCFSIAGVAPEFWTINNIEPINPKSTRFLTDVAFDMYHKWNADYNEVLRLMLERTGNRKDLRVWMIPCTMKYRGDKSEEYCIEHLNGCYETLKKLPCKGGLMCFTYYTFLPEEEALGNIGLDKLTEREYKNYWPELMSRIKEIGREIVSGELG